MLPAPIQEIYSWADHVQSHIEAKTKVGPGMGSLKKQATRNRFRKLGSMLKQTSPLKKNTHLTGIPVSKGRPEKPHMRCWSLVVTAMPPNHDDENPFSICQPMSSDWASDRGQMKDPIRTNLRSQSLLGARKQCIQTTCLDLFSTFPERTLMTWYSHQFRTPASDLQTI